MHLNYDRGVDVIQDTIDVALHFGYIDNSVQGTFKLIDTDSGEPLLNANGEPIKIRGRKNLYSYFKENISDWRMLYDKCYNKLKQKESPNIVAFEKMLNLDLNEKIGVDISKVNLEEI